MSTLTPISVNLIKSTGYVDKNLTKLQIALSKIPAILNSQQFKDAVINFKTNGRLTFSFKKNVFYDFEHYTNEQVYDLIMQAQEDPGDIANGSIDLYLELIPGGGGSTIGYGNPGDETIYTYADWFELARPKEVANHIIHEWCHKIGFDHAKYPWQDRNRSSSVPYGIGVLVETLFNLDTLVPTV